MLVLNFMDYYLNYERRLATFQKLYENHSLTYGQVDRLKTAIAAKELIPFAVYSPYLFLMLRLSAQATSAGKITKAIGIGLVGFGICECTSMELSQRVWWPITAKVYAEIIVMEK